jgi:hypothetical protein
MDGARIYLEAYEEDGVQFDSQTRCLLISKEGETELIFEARVQAHVDILNDHGPEADEDVGYDWELVPVVS